MLKRVQHDTRGQAGSIMGLRATVQRVAFTMAEILLSLTIIGVVAAITLPSLTGNINERTWNTQRKALYARFSQAIALMPALNGYATVTEESSSGAGDGVDTAAETFVTNVLGKVLQVNNVCDNTHLNDCGISSKITTMAGSTQSVPTTMKELNPKMVGSLNNGVQSFYVKDTKAAAFETKNGESIIAYVNPYCMGSLNDINWGVNSSGQAAGSLYQRTVCANFVFDLNGNKGPNTVGKDIGVMTVLYPSDPVVIAPQAAAKTLPASAQRNAGKACTNMDAEYRLPNLEETYAMFVNKQLLQPVGFTNTTYWSSTVQTRPRDGNLVGIAANMGTGEIDDWGVGTNYPVWCVKR